MTAPEFTDAEMLAECEHMALHWRQCAGESPHEIPRLVNGRLSRLYRAIAARIEAMPADWQPPPEHERPDGFRCLGFIAVWTEVVWLTAAGDDESEGFGYCWQDAAVVACDDGRLHEVNPIAFAPLPPTPKTDEVTK